MGPFMVFGDRHPCYAGCAAMSVMVMLVSNLADADALVILVNLVSSLHR